MKALALGVLVVLLATSVSAGDWRRRERRPARAFGPSTEHVIGGRAVTSDEVRPRRDHDRRRFRGFESRSEHRRTHRRRWR